MIFLVIECLIVLNVLFKTSKVTYILLVYNKLSIQYVIYYHRDVFMTNLLNVVAINLGFRI